MLTNISNTIISAAYQTQIDATNTIRTLNNEKSTSSNLKKSTDTVNISIRAKDLQHTYDEKQKRVKQDYTDNAKQIEKEYLQEKTKLEKEFAHKKQLQKVNAYV